jgi:hypothetical protein
VTPDAGVPEAPADPLAGKSPEERWRWAVERIPALAGVLQAPDPDFARWLDSRGRVVLHSPNLIGGRVQGVKGYKRCSPIEFLLKDGELIGRVPHDGSASKADYEGNHAEITLGQQVSSRPVIVDAKAGHGGRGGCGRTAPLLSENTAEVLRYEGLPMKVRAECNGEGLRRECPDGADPLRADLPALQVIIDEHRFQRRFEGGEMFFRDRAACLAATAPWGAPPREHAHGFPLHPDLARVCHQHVMGAPGPTTMEIDWSLYATSVPINVIVKWYQSRLGKALAKEKDGWIARLPTPDAPDHVLDISVPGAPGPSCGTDAPADTRTLVRVSTAVRR